MEKIVLCTFFSRHSGGLESHFNSLKKSLLKKDYDVKEIKMPKEKNIIKILKYFCKNIRYINNIDIFKNRILQDIYKEYALNSCKIYHFHDVLALYSLKHLKNNKNKFILTVHGPLSRESQMMNPKNKEYIKYIQNIEKEAYELADKIITVDSGQKEIILKDYNIQSDKIEIIFNAVDSNEFYFSKKEKEYFLVPRRLVKKNGVHIAIQAFQYINNVKLKIAGDGIEMENLKKIVKDLKLANKIEFLGDVNRENIKKLILEAKGIIIPSIPSDGVIEATSISALEGMSAGKVVFASKIGGLKELITNDINGVLFEAGNYEELAKIINNYLDNTNKKNIKENARKYILENSCLDVWIEKILKVYYEN